MQVESSFAIERTRTHNEMCKSTHGTRTSKLLRKPMLRNIRNALFLHDTAAQATWEGCLLFIKKYFKKHSITSNLYWKKVAFNFFFWTPEIIPKSFLYQTLFIHSFRPIILRNMEHIFCLDILIQLLLQYFWLIIDFGEQLCMV